MTSEDGKRVPRGEGTVIEVSYILGTGSLLTPGDMVALPQIKASSGWASVRTEHPKNLPGSSGQASLGIGSGQVRGKAGGNGACQAWFN